VVALNRAVAVAQVHGPKAGIEAVEKIKGRRALESYYLLHAVLGELESRMNQPKVAAGHFRKSLELTQSKTETAFLTKRLQACENETLV
jgi:RNA polymerase sigma-70 factor (ECF subfamily)